MRDVLLEVDGLVLELGGRRVLDGVSFSMDRGERLALVGASGSGKSVTLFALMGLLNLAPGAARARLVGGRAMLYLKHGEPGIELLRSNEEVMRSIRGRGVAMIFQEPMTALNPLIRCGEQVAESLGHLPLSKKEKKGRVMRLFEEVRLAEPERIWKSYPHQLSGGQRQRVMIAMALAPEPALILADEPTTALDATTQQAVLLTLTELCVRRGTALIFVTHDHHVAHKVCERFLHRSRERVVTEPAPRAGSSRVESIVHANPDRPHLLVSELSCAAPDKPAQKILQDVSFAVSRGEALAIVGESGSGKSTLARALLRLIPHQGSVRLGELEWSTLSPARLRRERHRMQLVQQDAAAALNPRLTVVQTLEEPLRLRLESGTNRSGSVRQQVEELLDSVQLPRRALDAFPHELSGGQRQRVCIARALAMRPELIICDEAVAALDPDLRMEILVLLTRLRNQLNVTILFITHDLGLARQLCESTLVLQQGRAVEHSSTHSVLHSPKAEYTQSLVDAASWADPDLLVLKT
jgi:peptide/nickel transport system ATP-binding protein